MMGNLPTRMGSAAEVGRYGINTSYMFHQDGSNTLDLGVDAKIPIQTPYVYLEINIGLGFSMNSYTGAVLSSHGGACVGEAGTCVGVDQGNSFYFDRGGGFQGMTVYTEVYMQIAGEARISTGYEAGLFGAEGRGLYVDGSAFGLHAGVSHLEDGYDPDNVYYGYHKQVDVMNYEWIDENSRLSILGLDVYLRMIMGGPNGMYTGQEHTRLKGNGLMINDGEGVYTFFAHGNPFAIGVEEGLRSLSAEEFAVLLKAGHFNYKGEKIIKLYACNTAGATEDGSMNFAQRLAEAMNVTVIAPTTRVNAEQLFGTTKVELMDHGLWHRCQPGAGCQPYQDAIGGPINWW